MDVGLGALAGLVTGVVGSVVAAFVQLLGKSLRNRSLARRGEGIPKDYVFRPLWVLCGIIGAIAGASWTWRLHSTWVTGAIAGLGAPALLTLVFVVTAIGQAVRR